LALFGRRPPQRVDSLVMPASENLHNLRHCTRTRTWGLGEGHADPVLLAPDDVTGNVRAVRLKNKVETLGDVVGGSATSSAAPEMVMSQTKQLIKQPAN